MASLFFRRRSDDVRRFPNESHAPKGRNEKSEDKGICSCTGKGIIWILFLVTGNDADSEKSSYSCVAPIIYKNRK